MLASASPRRREILSRLGLSFRQFSPSILEIGPDLARLDARRLVETLALRKAASYSPAGPEPHLVIGCDTLVFLGNETLGKPESRDRARDYLLRLSSREHLVMSGLAVRHIRTDRERVLSDTATTRVRFRALSRDEIDAYLDGDEWVDKAGAYAIQGAAGNFVEAIQGDYDNVVGLPVSLLDCLVGRLGLQLLPR